MNIKPLVSIIIPCYNHAQFVQESIQSVIDQDYENIELIIIDDGSSDNSVEVIQQLISVCKNRFKSFDFISRANKGLSATLNEGLSLAQGEIIGFCSSDDAFHKHKVSSQVAFFNTHSDIHFCYTQTYIFDDNGRILEEQTYQANKGLHENVAFEEVLTFKVHFPVTGMYRAHFLKDVLKGFDEVLSAEDYDISLRILSISKAGYIKDKLYYYRYPGAIGGSRKRMPMRVDVSESHLKTISKYKGNPCYKRAVTEWNYRRLVFFSSHKETKIYALKGMLLCIRCFFRPGFIKGVVKIILIWE